MMTTADYLFLFGLFLLFAASQWFIIKLFFDRQQRSEKEALEAQIENYKARLKKEDKKLITPIRLQAYERMILFLERINPQSMVFRYQKPGQKALELQTLLLQKIREEFEHNVSQQLYISKEAWAMVKTAKEEVVKLINSAAAGVQPGEPAIELSKAIINHMAKSTHSTLDSALNVIKTEIQKLF